MSNVGINPYVSHTNLQNNPQIIILNSKLFIIFVAEISLLKPKQVIINLKYVSLGL